MCKNTVVARRRSYVPYNATQTTVVIVASLLLATSSTSACNANTLHDDEVECQTTHVDVNVVAVRNARYRVTVTCDVPCETNSTSGTNSVCQRVSLLLDGNSHLPKTLASGAHLNHTYITCVARLMVGESMSQGTPYSRFGAGSVSSTPSSSSNGIYDSGEEFAINVTQTFITQGMEEQLADGGVIEFRAVPSLANATNARSKQYSRKVEPAPYYEEDSKDNPVMLAVLYSMAGALSVFGIYFVYMLYESYRPRTAPAPGSNAASRPLELVEIKEGVNIIHPDGSTTVALECTPTPSLCSPTPKSSPRASMEAWPRPMRET